MSSNVKNNVDALVKGQQLGETEVTDKPSRGLQEGGHIYPKCSNCDTILMDIWRTRPHEVEIWKVRAECPFCGDKSFIVEIQGGFHVGGYGQIKEDDEEDDFPSTVVEDCQFDNDTFVFKIKKAHANAKPLKR